jgi:16S rRNA C967 or C1407 C5-methylase (RsmB/RsmF family)
VVIEKLGPDGHSALETDFDSAMILLADEIARGCLIFSECTLQRIENEEELSLLEDSREDTVRVMVVPPIAGG